MGQKRIGRGLDHGNIVQGAILPYGLTVTHVQDAAVYVYGLVDGMNEFLTTQGYPRLERLILANSLSGIISEFTVVGLASACHSLARNAKVGGHPDLLRVGVHADDSALKGGDGIEVKASIHKGGWQGHNPEGGWIMIFRYQRPDGGPLTFMEILAADLAHEDWSFSGRSGTSRRTPTASIVKSGLAKLRANPVYRAPEATTTRRGRSRMSE